MRGAVAGSWCYPANKRTRTPGTGMSRPSCSSACTPLYQSQSRLQGRSVGPNSLLAVTTVLGTAVRASIQDLCPFRPGNEPLQRQMTARPNFTKLD